MTTEALALTEETALTLGVQRAPEEVLAEAHRAARALKEVIDAKPKKVVFNEETYLEFEDWQTVGRFYGIAPKVTATHYVDYGITQGWEASAEAVHVPTGRVVSSADSMCLNDEEKWRARPKYEWHYVKASGGTSLEDPGKDEIVWEDNPKQPGKKRPKKARVLVGEEAVPLFQLRSMAQTRACAKALRNALAWVVVLAGYRPMPAEELPDAQVVTVEAPPASVPAGPNGTVAPSASPTTATPEQTAPPAGPPPVISEPQARRFYAIAHQHGWSDEQIHDLLTARHRNSGAEILRSEYEELINRLKDGPKK